MKFTVILAPERGGRYSVICAAIPGCVSQGDSPEEALVNIREAILRCLEVRREDGLPLPVETPEIIAREIREFLEDRAAEGLPLTIETREVRCAPSCASFMGRCGCRDVSTTMIYTHVLNRGPAGVGSPMDEMFIS